MIRVLHFMSTPAKWSGVMSVIMNYYRHMDRSKVQFDFLCFIHDKNSYEEEIKQLGGAVYYVGKPGSSRRAAQDLKDFLQKRRGVYQWFHNHEVYLSFYLRPLVKKYGMDKFVIHCHATKYSDKWLNARRNQLLCVPIHFMDCKKMACSEAAAEFLYGKGAVQNKKIMILHNAVNCETYRFHQKKREEMRTGNLLNGRLVIGHVGRFEKQKNHDFLIEAFRYFHKMHPESVLLLIGDGSRKQEMQKKAEQLGLQDAILFLGQQTNVNDWYQAMDVLWLPSLYEGLPMAAVEAQASGLPCLLSDAITTEVGILESTTFLSLDYGPEYWARTEIPVKKAASREDAWRMVRQKGFEIEQECRVLQEFYLY